jgi:alkanesulfonate monooxygenase SsuD/methylene tetrahydromethanopterin reductase-like flavin-dependent oxidoreductase (luciferase family)
MHSLGIVLSTATSAPPKEFVELGQIAEDKGFAAVLVNEGRGDALACAEAIALGTSHIKVGTNIANIYFRHPFLAGMTATTISELSNGRLILGLGMSHRPLLESLGITMDQPRQYMRSYVTSLNTLFRGESLSSFHRPQKSTYKIPVYVGAVTVESAEVGGELADGIMPFLPALTYLTQLVEAAKSAAQRVGKDPEQVDCIVSIPTFICDDIEQARSAAQYNLAFFANLPFYRKQWRRCGFVDEVNALQEAWKKGDRRAAAECVSDRMVDQVCVFGPPSQCKEQLAAFHEAGAALPVLAVSPVNEDRLAATRNALDVLAP